MPFSQKVPNLFFLILTCAIVATILALTMATAHLQRQLSGYVIVGVFMVICIYFFSSRMIEFLGAPTDMFLGEEKIKISFKARKDQYLDLNAFDAIVPYLGNGLALKFIHKKNGVTVSFYVNSGMKDFGVFLETFLSRSLSLNRIKLDKTLAEERIAHIHWGKEIDWTIINTAKRRAEENCKNLRKRS